MYKKSETYEFKQKGLVNIETLKVLSTSKKTEGLEFDLKEALSNIASDGTEVEITFKKSDSVDSPDFIE